jgi:methanogenic corrinoid protein MtbC1
VRRFRRGRPESSDDTLGVNQKTRRHSRRNQCRQRALMDNLTHITNALADLDENRVLEFVKEALSNGLPAIDVLEACQAGMNEVGNRFEAQDYFVSDLIMSAEIFKQIGDLLDPHLRASNRASAGKIVMGTVQGDIHDIGKDIVVTMLRSAGFEVIDLGVDVPPARFVDALKQSGAPVLGLSGLLTLAFDAMKITVSAVAEAGLRDKVKIMVGGGPVDANVCRAVGADDWGPDAQQAVKLAKQWSGEAAAV